MSYQAIVASVQGVLEDVSGIKAVVPYAPALVHTTPLVFLVFDSYVREDDEQSMDDRVTTYRITAELLVPATEHAEAQIMPFIDSVQDAFDDDRTLGGTVLDAEAEAGDGVWVTIGQAHYRGVDFTITVVEAVDL